ncbi:reverse transcriptase domain-containing protein [Tanacetum coccineum]
MDYNRAVHAELLAYRAEVRALHEQISILQRQQTEDQRAKEPEPARDPKPQDGLADAGFADALAEYEAHRSSVNGDDSHKSRSGRMTERAAHDNCTVACWIKFATCTLLRNALTWWNSHIKTVGNDAAYGMPWKTLKKMITDKYYPRGGIKKLEIKLWNLKFKGTDMLSYNQRFQELAMMCSRIFPEESDEVEKYVGGLADMIQGSVMAFKPKTMQDAIEFATKLMDKEICTFAHRQAENKRKLNDNSRNNQN